MSNGDRENHGPIIQDEHHGIGGAYVFENGVRTRVEEPTQDHPEGNAPRNKDGSLIVFADGTKKKPKAPPSATAPAATSTADKKGAGK